MFSPPAVCEMCRVSAMSGYCICRVFVFFWATDTSRLLQHFPAPRMLHVSLSSDNLVISRVLSLTEPRNMQISYLAWQTCIWWHHGRNEGCSLSWVIGSIKFEVCHSSLAIMRQPYGYELPTCAHNTSKLDFKLNIQYIRLTRTVEITVSRLLRKYRKCNKMFSLLYKRLIWQYSYWCIN